MRITISRWCFPLREDHGFLRFANTAITDPVVPCGKARRHGGGARKGLAMNITHTLIYEHCVIEQVLNCLERMAERCESHRKLESGPARDTVAFLRGFIERYHDCKVESQLLPAMQAMGISAEKCLECPMRQSRKDSLPHLDAMEAAIEPACAGGAAALDKFAEHARAYINVLLDCIAKHEDCLFPLIEDAVRDTHGVPLEISDRECLGDDACIIYVKAANRLAEHFGVPPTAIADWRNCGDKANC